MKLMGIASLAAGPTTTKTNPAHIKYPYLLRGVVVDHPNQAWATDFTYVRGHREIGSYEPIFWWPLTHKWGRTQRGFSQLLSSSTTRNDPIDGLGGKTPDEGYSDALSGQARIA